MKHVLSLLFCLALAGCGYVGDPLPPALNIPQPVADLRVVQHAGQFVVDFTAPSRSTENLVFKQLGAIELRLTAPQGVDTYPVKAGPGAAVQVTIPSAKYAGRQVVFSVRAAGPHGRMSAGSNQRTLQTGAALSKPDKWTVTGTLQGVRIAWEPGHSGRVFRSAEGQETSALIGAAAEAYTDATAELGKSYTYRIQYTARGGDAEAESEISEPQRFTFADKFPPAAPAGLQGIPGLNSVELNWDPSPEPDFKAFQVYRAEGDADFAKLGEPVGVPSFHDTKVASAKRYRYRVTAVDQSGNESAPSAIFEINVP